MSNGEKNILGWAFLIAVVAIIIIYALVNGFYNQQGISIGTPSVSKQATPFGALLPFSNNYNHPRLIGWRVGKN